MSQVSFSVPKHVSTAIGLVASRYQAMRKDMGLTPVDMLDLHMDLTACHANGCPIDWEKLNGADDVTLAHDVGGIQRHINRRTGKLEDCFLPKCAAPEDDCAYEREMGDAANAFVAPER
ncbi:hypothetical protein WT88_29495 [Burkholderia stagnalis]|uniref:DUF6874 family protein n=1 Tax=Burkholderia stagnalis TaxID=1503054 RepID=UPI000757FDBE|nr:hypothetical protein [Burkholderia stagnalis]KVZ18619.1 hypothetical protein WT35_04435 [Burkholderia stagnalis]KWN32842.1 hypothetical protein WT86_18560 [Burkholderia stagnalis]KWN44669.1 hypothetical protein WT88_29495 [Burkholderia stagnalis]KWN54402.1 hypothetical protein WT87_03590 [Burkholderia stagnalis]KWO68809.1 hypothetical protein WT99_20960 [Burkholderia stagnalis]